jgi:hypothetical protein
MPRCGKLLGGQAQRRAEPGAFAHSGAAADGKRKARQRSPRWMELGEGTTTAAQEEARKEAISGLLRAPVEDSRRGVQVRVFLARWESLW